MKTYFVNPPAASGVKIVREGRCMQRKGAWTSVWPPISLALCAAVLEEEGVEVKLSDCIVEEIDHPSIAEKVAASGADLVVLNTATPSIASDLQTAALIKEARPSCKVAAIGIHVSVLPEDSLRLEPHLDYAIRGEPEYTVRELALGLQNDGAVSDIPGISYRHDGSIVHNPDREPIPDLDVLPFPSWHLVDKRRYTMPFTDSPFFLVATSRGCPFRCTFCADEAYYGRKLRVRSPRKIVDELVWDKEEFGVSEFLFWAEGFTINPNFAKRVAQEIIDRKIEVRWVCNSRVDTVDRELLSKLKQAGCWMIGYGIESGSQRILDECKKGITLEQIKRAVDLAHEEGLEVTGHTILGFPGETEETAKETIEFTKKLDLDFVQYYCCVPFPGSDLYREAQEKGWINTSDWTYFEQNYSVLDTETMTAERVMRWRSQAYRQFYMRPKMIFRTLLRVRGFKELRNFLRMLLEFLGWI